MIVTTTDSVEGNQIEAYLGVVSTVRLERVSLGSLLNASGRPAIEDALREAASNAMEDLASQATLLGANAVVGLRTDFEIAPGSQCVMLMGTAVRLRR